MKKIVGFTLFVLIFALCSVIDVEATSLNMKDITLECIYSDGGLYTSAYGGVDEETGNDKYIVNRNAYNLVGVDNNSANKGSASIVLNNMFIDNRCHDYLYVLTADVSVDESAETVDYNSDESTSFYNFGARSDSNVLSSGFIRYRGNLIFLREGFWGADVYQDKYVRLSERYILNSDAPQPNAIVYYKQEATQVAGKDSFVSIMIYDNVVLMKKNDRITRLVGDYKLYEGITKSDDDVLSKEVPEKIWINNPEPEAVSNSSANVSYRIESGQKVFSVLNAESGDATHRYEYILTDEVPDGDDGKGNALCDEILVNTSPYLKQAIKAMQVLIPLFLILLTGFDIGKIVLTGNIEEELPKRKKLVIARFIAAIVFFFLPSFISLFTTWLIDSGAKNVDSIEYIDCLFK